MDNKDLKKSVDLLNNNITKLLEQHNNHMKSIKQTMNIFLFVFIVNLTVMIVGLFLLIK